MKEEKGKKVNQVDLIQKERKRRKRSKKEKQGGGRKITIIDGIEGKCTKKSM